MTTYQGSMGTTTPWQYLHEKSNACGSWTNDFWMFDPQLPIKQMDLEQMAGSLQSLLTSLKTLQGCDFADAVQTSCDSINTTLTRTQELLSQMSSVVDLYLPFSSHATKTFDTLTSTITELRLASIQERRGRNTTAEHQEWHAQQLEIAKRVREEVKLRNSIIKKQPEQKPFFEEQLKNLKHVPEPILYGVGPQREYTAGIEGGDEASPYVLPLTASGRSSYCVSTSAGGPEAYAPFMATSMDYLHHPLPKLLMEIEQLKDSCSYHEGGSQWDAHRSQYKDSLKALLEKTYQGLNHELEVWAASMKHDEEFF